MISHHNSTVQKSIPESGGRLKVKSESHGRKSEKMVKCGHQRRAFVTQEKQLKEITLSYFLENKTKQLLLCN